jgi:hypothetical protein
MRKHSHKWKIHTSRIHKLERLCDDCRAVQHAELSMELWLTIPASLYAYADVEWRDGPLPKPEAPLYGFGYPYP